MGTALDHSTIPPDVAGIVLAGGQSRRMGGGDKALLPLAGQPMIAHVIARLGCARAISANGDPARFAGFGLPVLPDSLPDWPGPLAGVLAGMHWAAAQGFARIVTASADTPFLPPDMAARLAASTAPITFAWAEGQDHPVCAMWDVSLRGDLRDALLSGLRRPRDFMQSCGAEAVVFPVADAFFNANTPDDLAHAAARLAR